VALGENITPSQIRAGYSINYETVSKRAAKILNIPHQVTDLLFYKFEWPAYYIREWNKAKSIKKRAEIAVKRIEHFIRKGE
jgi:hypothetical protein